MSLAFSTKAGTLAQVVSVLGAGPWIVRSGVAFSPVINTCSPYRLINGLEGANVADVTGGLRECVFLLDELMTILEARKMQ